MGYTPPAGSSFVASRDFHGYKLELYDGSDGLRYYLVYPKREHPDDEPTLLGFFGEANKLAVEYGRRLPDRYGIVDTRAP